MATNNRLVSTLSSTGDTALWLHNKLGTSNDLWSDNSSIISQLNTDVLRNIKECFLELQVNVKLKLLLSFLHISRRNLDEWKCELEELLEIAIEDSDPWVSVIGEMLKNFPRHGTINFDFHSNSSTFFELVNDVKKMVKKHGDKGILPLESIFLNKNAFTSNFGQIPQPTKHFTLRRKAKSATLRAELLQKASEASAGKRTSTGPAVPIRCRGLNSDSTPLKGIPSRNHFANNSYSSSFGKSSIGRLSTGSNRFSRISSISANTSSNTSGGIKRDGGIVLLDIAEAPSANQRDLKRRKTTKNPEQPEKENPSTTSSVTSSVTTSSVSVTSAGPSSLALPSPTVTTSAMPTSVVGHKSVGKTSEASTASSVSGNSILSTSVAKTSQPQLSTVGSNQPADNFSSHPVTASKSTPDYAAGLMGSSGVNNQNSSSFMHQPTTVTKSSSLGSSLLSSNSASSSLISSSHPTSLSAASSSYSNPYMNSSSSSISANSSTSANDHRQPTGSFPMLKQTIAAQQQHQQQQAQYNNYSYQSGSNQTQPNSSSVNTTNNSNMYTAYSAQSSQPSSQQQSQPQRQLYSNIQSSTSTSNPSNVGLSMSQQQQHKQSVILTNPTIQQQQIHYQQQQQMTANGSQVMPQPMMHQQQPAQYGMYGQPQQQSQQQSQQNTQSQQTQSNAQTHQQQTQQQTQSTQRSQQPVRLYLSRELTQIATELFQTSNCLSRPEKALILGFMAGSRENPCPQLGPTSMIKLNESVETRTQPDGSLIRVVVEQHFQMNYNTGDWRKVEKIRPADGSIPMMGGGTNMNGMASEHMMQGMRQSQQVPQQQHLNPQGQMMSAGGVHHLMMQQQGGQGSGGPQTNPGSQQQQQQQQPPSQQPYSHLQQRV